MVFMTNAQIFSVKSNFRAFPNLQRPLEKRFKKIKQFVFFCNILVLEIIKCSLLIRTIRRKLSDQNVSGFSNVHKSYAIFSIFIGKIKKCQNNESFTSLVVRALRESQLSDWRAVHPIHLFQQSYSLPYTISAIVSTFYCPILGQSNQL